MQNPQGRYCAKSWCGKPIDTHRRENHGSTAAKNGAAARERLYCHMGWQSMDSEKGAGAMRSEGILSSELVHHGIADIRSIKQVPGGEIGLSFCVETDRHKYFVKFREDLAHE